MPSSLTGKKAGTVAIVCVECQNGMLGRDSVLPALAADAGKLVQNLSRLLYAARGGGIRVVHATYEGTSGGRPTGTARLWRALGPAIAEWEPGATATKVIDELLAPGDLVLARHHGLFPTLDTELLPVLRDLGIQTDSISRGVTEFGFAAHGRARHAGGFRGCRTARRGGRHPHRVRRTSFGQHHRGAGPAHHR